jgi:hypothetical protein
MSFLNPTSMSFLPHTRLVRKPIVLYERDSWWLSERHVVLPEPAAYAAIVTRAPPNTAAAKGRWMFLRL